MSKNEVNKEINEKVVGSKKKGKKNNGKPKKKQ